MASMEKLLVNVTPLETRVAMLESGRVTELHVERKSSRSLVGNIYRGKIVRVLPGMQAAFVDIGLSKNGFLHLKQIVGSGQDSSEPELSRPLSIQDFAHLGEIIWVQVLKDPIGAKGARLTTELSIAVPNLVFLPAGSGVAISNSIQEDEKRVRLKAEVERLKEENQIEGGFIIRTHAGLAQDPELQKNIGLLSVLWHTISEKMRAAKTASLVYQEGPIWQKILRDLGNNGFDKILVDSKLTADLVLRFTQDFMPQLTDRIEYYNGSEPLFEHYSIEAEIDQALQREVPLKSGGNLIIEQTEALAVIDVNTGSYVGNTGSRDTVLQINLEAAEEIAHQLRLRNLGGIIVVDFIDMLSTKDQNKVVSNLQDALLKDPVHTRLSGISDLGLVEISRKRTRESLQQLMYEACEICEGRGTVQTVDSMCSEIIRAVLHQHIRNPAKVYTIVASPDVIAALAGEQAGTLSDLQAALNCMIKIRAEQELQRPDYSLTLG
jgi:ribonuclease G